MQKEKRYSETKEFGANNCLRKFVAIHKSSHPININRVGMELIGLNTLTKLTINMTDALTSPALAFDWNVMECNRDTKDLVREGSSGRRKNWSRMRNFPNAHNIQTYEVQMTSQLRHTFIFCK